MLTTILCLTNKNHNNVILIKIYKKNIPSMTIIFISFYCYLSVQVHILSGRDLNRFASGDCGTQQSDQDIVYKALQKLAGSNKQVIRKSHFRVFERQAEKQNFQIRDRGIVLTVQYAFINM